jgi:hypothetical protein
LLSVKKPVLTEFYDEFVFVDPSENTLARLAQPPVPAQPLSVVDQPFACTSFSFPEFNVIFFVLFSKNSPYAFSDNLEQFVADEKHEIARLAQCHLDILSAIQELKKRFDKTHYEGLRYRKLIASCKKKEEK